MKEIIANLNENLINFERFKELTRPAVEEEISKELLQIAEEYKVSFVAKYNKNGNKYDFNAISRFEQLNENTLIFHCTKMGRNRNNIIAELIKFQIDK